MSALVDHTLISPPPPPTVQVTDTAVLLDGFVEQDPEVVAAISAADEPETAVHTRLRLGTKVLRLAGTTGEVEFVRAEMERLTKEVDAAVDTAAGKVTSAAKDLLDSDHGALAAALTTFSGKLGTLLGETFDPASRDSVIATIEKMVAETLKQAGDQQLDQFRRVMNPDLDESPLGRFRHELLKAVTDQATGVLGEVRALSQTLAGQAAAAKVFELTTHKGRRFEDQLHALIEQAASGYGDLAEQTGSATGSAGTKKGDEVVTLNPDNTRTASAAYVFEIKDRKLSLRKTLEELDAAMSNREATAGVAVFSRQDRAPTTQPFIPFGTKALLVVDKDDPDPNVVRLACMWARWIVCRELTMTDSADIDLDRLSTQIDAARRALSRITTIRRAHSAAKNSLGNAGAEVETLSAELAQILDGIEDELGHS